MLFRELRHRHSHPRQPASRHPERDHPRLQGRHRGLRLREPRDRELRPRSGEGESESGIEK